MEQIDSFTIQQAAERTGLTAHTLRYYERIGLLEDVHRAENGHRQYTEDDLGWIHLLKCLRATGMPIAQMKDYAELTREGSHTVEDRLDMLENHRRSVIEQIAELQAYLTMIDNKINYYAQEQTLLEEA